MESFSISCKVVFVDTDRIPATESRAGDLTQNVTEAVLVNQVCKLVTTIIFTHRILRCHPLDRSLSIYFGLVLKSLRLESSHCTANRSSSFHIYLSSALEWSCSQPTAVKEETSSVSLYLWFAQTTPAL